MKGGAPLLAALCALSGCARHGEASAVAAPAPAAAPGWRAVATRVDAQRLYNWREAFVRGLKEARAGGAGAKIDAEGALLQPDAALPEPMPPVGAYRCRVTKLGSQTGETLTYVAYPAFDCRVTSENGRLRLVKLTGSQRPSGLLFPDGAKRAIFLGTLALGDEATAMSYGRDATRDLAGTVERIGPRRWRLLIPYPRFESLIDVLELVPA